MTVYRTCLSRPPQTETLLQPTSPQAHTWNVAAAATVNMPSKAGAALAEMLSSSSSSAPTESPSSSASLASSVADGESEAVSVEGVAVGDEPPSWLAVAASQYGMAAGRTSPIWSGYTFVSIRTRGWCGDMAGIRISSGIRVRPRGPSDKGEQPGAKIWGSTYQQQRQRHIPSSHRKCHGP